MRAKELSAQISAQFEEMHCFLKKKEEEIKKQLKAEEQDAITAMCKNTSTINKRLMDGKELECIFQSALDINQPDLFLQVTPQTLYSQCLYYNQGSYSKGLYYNYRSLNINHALFYCLFISLYSGGMKKDFLLRKE